MRLHATVSKDGHSFGLVAILRDALGSPSGRPQCSSEGVILSCVSDEYS